MIKQYTFFSLFILSIISCDKTEVTSNSCDSLVNGQVIDIDGNAYNTVKIGNQTWMAENLKVTKYNDGTPIPFISSSIVGLQYAESQKDAYTYYNFDNLNSAIYGNLYNWYAVNTGNLCPCGWHVPTVYEWLNLLSKLGGEEIAGGALKQTGTNLWLSPNTGATNSSQFNAVPGGVFYEDEFKRIGEEADWWSSTVDNYDFEEIAISFETRFNTSRLSGGNGDQVGAKSIRCVKNFE